jgi:tetratricopeptide (TPR) repeat protein
MRYLSAVSFLFVVVSTAAIPVGAQTPAQTPSETTFEMPGVFRITLPPGWQQGKVIDDRNALAVFSNKELTLEVIRDLNGDPSDKYAQDVTDRRMRPEADDYAGKYTPPEVRSNPESFQVEITSRFDQYTLIGGLPAQWVRYHLHYTHPQKEGEAPKTDEAQVNDAAVWSVFILSPGEYWSLELRGDEKADWSSDVKRMVRSFQLLEPVLSRAKAAIPKEAYDRMPSNLPEDKCEFVGTSSGMGIVIPCAWDVMDRQENAAPQDPATHVLLGQEALYRSSPQVTATLSHYSDGKAADEFVQFAENDLADVYKQTNATGLKKGWLSSVKTVTQTMTYERDNARQVTVEGLPATLVSGAATAKKVNNKLSVQLLVVTKGTDHFTLVVQSSTDYCAGHTDECGVDQIVGSLHVFALHPPIAVVAGRSAPAGNAPTKEQLDSAREDARLFNNSDSHYNLGKLLDASGDHDGAFTEFKTAVALNPRNIDANREAARVFANHNYVNDAIAADERILYYEADRDNDVATHAQLAILYARRGDLVIALNHSNLAGESAPVNIMSADDKAAADKELGNLSEQLDKATKDAGPNMSPQSMLFDAELGMKLGDFAGADIFCSSVFQSDPHNTRALSCLEQTTNARGDRDSIITYAQDWLALSPDNPGAYYWLAHAYLWDPVDYKKAAQSFEAVIRHLNTVDVSPLMLEDAQVSWPKCYEFASLWQDAANAYESTSGLFPTNAEVLNNTAWFFATTTSALRNPRKALDYANRAVAAKPNDPNIMDTQAEAYFVSGRIDDAIATEQKALALAPNRDDLQKQLAKFKQAKKPKLPPKK